MPTPHDIIQRYLDWHYPVIAWPQVGDLKGPTDKDWPQKNRITTYKENHRYGLLLGAEVAPSQYLTDVDIDWAPGTHLAQAFVPPTTFVFGHGTKQISHCFYTATEPLPSYEFRDPVDKTMLIELRGTNKDGSLGHQTMVPPSVWSKNGRTEPLVFVRDEGPMHIEATLLKQRVTYAAITMLLAKHLGTHGFGHEPRLMWAGYLLRAGLSEDDLVTMGKAISTYCDNREVEDIRFVIKSTADALGSNKKARGGPSLARHLGTHGKAIIHRINEWLGRDQDFLRIEGVIIKDSQENIRRAVDRLGHDLTYNTFADKMLIDGASLEDRHVNEVWLRIDEEYRFRPTFTFFEKVLHRLVWSNTFHPVKDYLATLTWDQIPRIDTWLIESAGAPDTPYVRAVSSILLVAAVRRIYQPGAKYDEMLVLESQQGLNKSSALRALCPKDEWFSDDLPLNSTSQRMIEATLGKWIIEAAELAGRRKAEIEHLKSSISRQVDGPARLAYAREPVERPRQFVVIGTTNSPVYLADPTGARRFWPVTVQSFDVSWIHTHRDSLWAEARAREQTGESIRLREALWPDATRQQEKRREVDPWEEPIRTTLLNIEPSGDGKRRCSAEQVWDGLGIAIDRRDRSGALRLAEVMHRFGFKRTTVRVSGEVCTGYVSEQPEALTVVEDTRLPGEDDDAGEVRRRRKDDSTPF